MTETERTMHMTSLSRPQREALLLTMEQKEALESDGSALPGVGTEGRHYQAGRLAMSKDAKDHFKALLDSTDVPGDRTKEINRTPPPQQHPAV